MSPHHAKYYEREGSFVYINLLDGYVYTPAELEAYRVNHRVRSSKCVNFFIPMQQCLDQQSFLNNFADPKRGPCSEQSQKFQECMQIYGQHQQACHIQNMFYNDEAKAHNEGVSPTLQGFYYKSPMSYTF